MNMEIILYGPGGDFFAPSGDENAPFSSFLLAHEQLSLLTALHFV